MTVSAEMAADVSRAILPSASAPWASLGSSANLVGTQS